MSIGLRYSALLLALGACNATSDGNASAAANGAEPAQERNVIAVAEGDREMNAAKQEGQATLPQFLERFAQPAGDETDFSVKYDIDPGSEAELIWAKVDRVEGDAIVARLANEPILAGHVIGEEVRIPKREVVDWGYLKGRRMEGHRTTRVLLKQMPADQAAAYRDMLGWD